MNGGRVLTQTCGPKLAQGEARRGERGGRHTWPPGDKRPERPDVHFGHIWLARQREPILLFWLVCRQRGRLVRGHCARPINGRPGSHEPARATVAPD